MLRMLRSERSPKDLAPLWGHRGEGLQEDLLKGTAHVTDWLEGLLASCTEHTALSVGNKNLGLLQQKR